MREHGDRDPEGQSGHRSDILHPRALAFPDQPYATLELDLGGTLGRGALRNPPAREAAAPNGRLQWPAPGRGRLSPAAPRPGPDRRQVIRRRRARWPGPGVLVALLAVVLIASGGSGASSRTRNHGAVPQAGATAQTAAAAPPGSAPPKAQPTPAGRGGRDQPRALLHAGGGGRWPPGQRGGAHLRRRPRPIHPGLVATLDRLHVHATFFAIGEMERYFSDGTLRRAALGRRRRATTPRRTRCSRACPPREQHEEIFEQIVRIEVLGGPRPRLFRPPYGSFNATTFANWPAGCTC